MYIVSDKASVRGSKKLYMPGEVFPEKELNSDNKHLLDDGYVVVHDNSPGSPQGGRSKPVQKWMHNPAVLAEKDIDELNVIIQDERGATNIDDFDTVEEAAVFLSQNYKEPEGD